MKKLLLSSSFITIVVMGINFLFKIYLSYKIPKDEIGVFYTFMDLISIGIMFFSGYKDSLIRAYDKENFEKVLFWYIYSFWFLFGFILIGEVIYYHILDFKYPLYFLVLLLFFNALMVFISYLNASYKVYKVMLFENFVMAVGLVISFFLFSFFFQNIYSLFFAFLSSYFFRMTYIFFFSPIKWDRVRSSFSEVKEFFTNTLYSGAMYFFSGLFISMSGIVLLKLFDDSTVLAEYQVVVRSIFFSLVAVFVFPLNTFTFPQISKLITNQEYHEIKRIEDQLVKYLVLFFIILLVGSLFTKMVIGWVFPIEYQESYKMLNMLLPLLPFIAYTTFALNIIKAFDRFDLALYVRVVGSVVFFVSIYIFYLLQADATVIVYSLDLSFVSMFLVALFYKKGLLV